MEQQLIDKLLSLLRQAIDSGNPPFSALLVREGKIFTEGVNRSNSDNNPLAHAEINAIQSALKSHGPEAVAGYELISSNEPCPMCMGASIYSGISRVQYFLSQDELREIRGWGQFVPAKTVAQEDASGIQVVGPLGSREMLEVHKTYWK